MSRVVPENFSGPTPPPRIMGAEMELDVRYASGQALPQDGQELIDPRILGKADVGVVLVPGEAGRPAAWLRNGAMIYLDRQRPIADPTGEFRAVEPDAKLEYCTPEVLGPRRLVAAVKAGRLVMQKLRNAYTEIRSHEVRVYGHNGMVDFAEERTVTSGFHVNFIIPEWLVHAPQLEIIESLWATQAYAWGGAMGLNGYMLSQKAWGIGQGIIKSKFDPRLTQEDQKPMGTALAAASDEDINAEDGGFGRLEDRTKESTTGWGLFMGAAATSLMLRVLEHPELTELNHRLQSLRLTHPAYTLWRAAEDLDFQEMYGLRDGRTMGLLELQRGFLEIAQELASIIRLPEDELKAIEEWATICDDLDTYSQNHELGPIANRIGWALRLSTMKEYGRKTGEPALSSPSAGVSIPGQNFSLSWDRIAPPGILDLAEAKKAVQIADGKLIKTYTDGPPPQGTRARRRTELLFRRNLTPRSVHWNSVHGSVRQGDSRVLKFWDLHPYAN